MPVRNSTSAANVLHRVVPLVCQALLAARTDDLVWIEGLDILSDPKLHNSMSGTKSIWLPLLLKGLEPTSDREIILAALRLLHEMTDILARMKPCLVKPLRALGKSRELDLARTEEMRYTVHKLGLTVWDADKVPIGLEYGGTKLPEPLSHATSITAPPTVPREHPLLSEILHRTLPFQLRSVRNAWTHTLFSSDVGKASIWLHRLYQATVEASGSNEVVIASSLGPLVHRELFHTAFLKCYEQLLVDSSLIRLLSSQSISSEIHVVLLDLVAEFSKESIPLPQPVLDSARQCALTSFGGELHQPLPAVVLWYAEQQTADDLCAANIANLVDVNIRIGGAGYDSAWSSLLWLRDDFEQHPSAMWLTHLGHWQTALKRQDHIDGHGPVKTFESFETRIICHHALGQFEKAYNLAQSFFEGLSDEERRKTAHWATAAAWHMDDFNAMADYVAFHPKGTSKSLYKAIIDIHCGEPVSAYSHIDKAQKLSCEELQEQLAIETLTKTEVLVELQEAIQYQTWPHLRDRILRCWVSRFKRSHADANTWLKRLRVWMLASEPTNPKIQACMMDCAKLCEGSGMREAAAMIINWAKPAVHPPGCHVEYTRLRFEMDGKTKLTLSWQTASLGDNKEGMQNIVASLHEHLSMYLDSLGVDRMALEKEGMGIRPLDSLGDLSEKHKHQLSRRYYRLAQWTENLQADFWVTDVDSEVYRYYSLSYKLDDCWYTGGWSLARAAMTLFEANGHARSDALAVNSYVVPAIRGLFQAVRSRETPERMIKALLRLVTLWFRYGESESVLVEVEQQLAETSISSWLMALPQLIARLGTLHRPLQNVLINLLENVASQYPHAIIWPLLTATQTRKPEHEDAARMIMRFICTMPDGTRLVQQAQLVGRELIRASMSSLEKWRNIIDKCLPRQDLMEIAWQEVPNMWADEIEAFSTPETRDEERFATQYGPTIMAIYNTLVKYRRTGQLNLVHLAYNDLHKLHCDIEAQVTPMRTPGRKLQLANAAPRLLTIRDCLLIVPGQYDHTVKLDDQSFIASFRPTMDVLSTKQCPRKLVIMSYSSDFTFLLKGNEDLRGDERIMQLFSLINTLLNHESEAFDRNLHLLPYEVIPLSPSAGLIGWVQNTQQLQAMIQSNRDRNKVNHLMNQEVASLLGYDPNTFDPRNDRPRLDPPAEMDKYDKLPLETKVKRLQAALAHSKQTDLKEVLWHRAPSAEVWIRRRTNFARTLGVGSFVGYIIGLGDRHGSNILVDQLTWGALHIDFGDLFGVAQERHLLPEKVPFRLTRSMTNAFELACSKGHVVPGSRGSYKQASIVSMSVMRDGRSTLMAMLEAFLYDPLLSWTSATVPATAEQDDPAGVTDGPSEAVPVPKPAHRPTVKEGVAPAQSQGGSGLYSRIDNSLINAYLDADSYMAKASVNGLTNRRALVVLAQIERKLAGFLGDADQPVEVKKQVQVLIEEATDMRNLAQGYVLGWMPHW